MFVGGRDMSCRGGLVRAEVDDEKLWTLCFVRLLVYMWECT